MISQRYAVLSIWKLEKNCDAKDQQKRLLLLDEGYFFLAFVLAGNINLRMSIKLVSFIDYYKRGPFLFVFLLGGMHQLAHVFQVRVSCLLCKWSLLGWDISLNRTCCSLHKGPIIQIYVHIYADSKIQSSKSLQRHRMQKQQAVIYSELRIKYRRLCNLSRAH